MRQLYGYDPDTAPPDGHYTTTYQYDVLDNLTTVNQGAQTRSFVYDSLSRLSSATNPEMVHPTNPNLDGTVSYTYDANGNLLTRTDARGAVTTFDAYDGLNRPPRKSYSDGATAAVRYCYDGKTYDKTTGLCTGSAASPNIGRLTAVGSGLNSSALVTTYGYDVLGRVTQSSQTTATLVLPSMGYVYNLASGMTSQTYPSGRVASFGYDNGGRLLSVSAPSSIASSFGYAAHGAPSQFQLGSGKWEHTVFNNRLQLTEIGLGTSANDSSLLRLQYAYDTTNNNGNLLSQTITSNGFTGTQLFGYDSLNRLKVAAEGGTANPPQCPDPQQSAWCEAYGYDRYGNRWVSAWSGVVQQASTPTSESVINAARNRFTTSTYDKGGNQTAAGDGRYSGTFTYDAENQQTAAAITELASANFTYAHDGEGRRVKKSVYGMDHVYAYNAQGQLVAEYRNGSLWKKFIFAGGRLLAVISPTTGTSHVTADHLGSTRMVTDASGNVKSCHDYLPFGKEISAGTGGRPACYAAEEHVLQRFSGKEVDPETGLQYFGARYHSGRQGRFTSPDPENASGMVPDPQSWNGYAYGRNNPLLYTDPTGRKYRICDTGGNCYDEYSDEDFDENFRNDKSVELRGTAIYQNGELIGTFERLSVDPKLSPWDLPGQWFAGFVDLFINSKPSGAARMAYAYAGDFSAGFVIGTTIQTGAGAVARNLPFKNPDLIRRVSAALDAVAAGAARYNRDGKVFRNAEGLLPAQASGYYREFTVQPAGSISGRGAERLVVGQGGEVYYTPNHYGSFVRIQ